MSMGWCREYICQLCHCGEQLLMIRRFCCRPRNGSALLYCSSAVQAALMVQAGIPLIAAALVTLLAPILASVWPWSL
jgi:hypothetical protein